MKQKQKKQTETDKKVKQVKKAIVNELIKNKIDKTWIKNHLIITGI
jgi:hypothetical protein